MHFDLNTREMANMPQQSAPMSLWTDLFQPIRRSVEVSAVAANSNDLAQTEAIIFALAQAVEQRDRYTAFHCERLAFISVALGILMGLDRAQLLTLYRGGYLHDVGKMSIPDAVLFKPGKLNRAEWEIMRSHSVRGVEICRPLKSLAAVVPLVRHHHERWDGSGYPDGLTGEEIPLLARLLQVADIYDALTSPRPYKQASSPEGALRILREETARGWRDPQVVELFFRLHKEVISKTGQFLPGSDRNLEAMRSALARLQLRV